MIRRSTLRSAALVTMALALLTGGCAFVTAPASVDSTGSAICLPNAPASAAAYQAVFSTRGPVWAGGDGAAPVALPDGRVLWLFGDTIIGGVGATAKLVGSWHLIHSSFLVQTGRCFAVVVGSPTGTRTSVIPEASGGRWYWPNSGYYDPVSNRVVLFAYEVMSDPTQPAGWQWKVTKMVEVRLSYPSLDVVGVQPLPFSVAAGAPMLGATTIVDAGWVYVYGASTSGEYVARSALGSSASGPWSYWSSSGWQTSSGSASQMAVTGQGSVSPWTVVGRGGSYLAVGKTWDAVSDDVWSWSGPSPTGPWTSLGRVATTPTAGGVFSYGGKVANLPGAGMSVIYSTNTSLSAVAGNVLLYGPKVLPYVPAAAGTSAARAPALSATPAVPSRVPTLLSGVGHTVPGG